MKIGDNMWWIILFITIVIVVNIFINKMAKKYNCYKYMQTISMKEAMKIQIVICVIIIVLLTIFLDLIHAFESYVITIIYFAFIVLLAITSSKIAKFIIALDMKKSGKKVDMSISGKDKDRIDAVEDVVKAAAVLSALSSDGNKIKKKTKDFLDSEEIKAIERGEQDSWNFEEEDLEDDDYYSEDDE